LGNLFGTTRRIALAMGASADADPREALRDVGVCSHSSGAGAAAWLPRRARALGPDRKQVMHMAPKEVSGAPCQAVVWEGKDVDLSRLPIQTCWPGDAAPLITWGLTITRGRARLGRISVSTASS